MVVSTDGWHESLRAEDSTRLPSNRAFGFTLSGALFILGMWTLWRQGSAAIFELGGSAVFLAATVLRPRLLAPLNRVWSVFGAVLQRIASPIVMAILYYGVVTPIGLLLRVFGGDPLRLRIDPKLASYWIPRSGNGTTSMKNQF